MTAQRHDQNRTVDANWSFKYRLALRKNAGVTSSRPTLTRMSSYMGGAIIVITLAFAIKMATASSAKPSSTKTRRKIERRMNKRAAKNKQVTPTRTQDTNSHHQPTAHNLGLHGLTLTNSVVSGIFEACWSVTGVVGSPCIASASKTRQRSLDGRDVRSTSTEKVNQELYVAHRDPKTRRGRSEVRAHHILHTRAGVVRLFELHGERDAGCHAASTLHNPCNRRWPDGGLQILLVLLAGVDVHLQF